MRWMVVWTVLAGCVTEPGQRDVDRTKDGLEDWNGSWLWPLEGRNGHDWVVQNYVDLAQGPGMRDYSGQQDELARTYDDHKGVDIDISTFREMDAGVPIYAVASGVVTYTHDGEYDRNTAWLSSDWNYVQIDQDDGYTVVYGHMRTDSVAVEVGDTVEGGTELGLVGSSGRSTHPHLHIEAWDNGYGNILIDPYEKGLWSSAPPYVTDLSLMDVILRPDGFNVLPDIQDPPPTNSARVAAGQTIGMGVSAAGGYPGDTIQISIAGPSGVFEEPIKELDEGYRHHFWWWNYYFNTTGNWSVAFRANGEEIEKIYFEVF